jgi:quinol monooxygenase YgiN
MQVEELAKEIASGVEATEPGVLKYQWFKAGTPEEPKIVVWEVYVLHLRPTPPLTCRY